MYRIDSVLAVDFNFLPAQTTTLIAEPNFGDNSAPSFGEYFDEQLQTAVTPQEAVVAELAELPQTPAASFLAWHYPPMMVLPKPEEKIEDSAE